MALPSSGNISFSDISLELYGDANKPIDFSIAAVYILAGKTGGGSINLSDFYGKKGNFSVTQSYVFSYGTTPPATVEYKQSGNSGTTPGYYTGTLNKTGAASNNIGSWSDNSSDIYYGTVSSGYSVGQQLGSTTGPTASDPYEYRNVVSKLSAVGGSSYQFTCYYKTQKRLYQTLQSYTGTVYLQRG